MKLKQILAIITLILLVASCDMLGGIDKITPDYKLTDNNVISDAKSAEAGINGVYMSWRETEMGWMRHRFDILTQSGNDVGVHASEEFKENAVQDVNVGITNNYSQLYYVIQNVSLFLENLNRKETLPGLSKERKTEMIGEALYSRAQAKLFLLRQYGEFFNTKSEYGIVLPPEGKSISFNTPIKRSTVEESYKSILSDLDEAIAKAPDKNNHYKVSKLTAKALKARVLLYLKDFSAASNLAADVIARAPSAGYAIQEDFKKMFADSFESPEMLFALYSMHPQEIYGGGNWNRFVVGSTTTKIATSMIPGKTDRRFTIAFKELDKGQPQIKNNKYQYVPYTTKKQGSHYYIRLAEMYYIIAEAETRLGKADAARKALKEIICIPRAGYTSDYVDAISTEKLLETILRQKWMEFTTENNEEWFDLVRYRAWDNYAIKPFYIKSDEHLLLPIPRKAIEGNNLLKQNPGYAVKK